MNEKKKLFRNSLPNIVSSSELKSNSKNNTPYMQMNNIIKNLNLSTKFQKKIINLLRNSKLISFDQQINIYPTLMYEIYKFLNLPEMYHVMQTCFYFYSCK